MTDQVQVQIPKHVAIIMDPPACQKISLDHLSWLHSGHLGGREFDFERKDDSNR